jgi:hypothetical protein
LLTKVISVKEYRSWNSSLSNFLQSPVTSSLHVLHASRQHSKPASFPFYSEGNVGSFIQGKPPVCVGSQPRLRKIGVITPFPHTPSWYKEGQIYVC